MPDQKTITLRQGEASPKDVKLYALPLADVVTTTIYLTQGEASAKDILLRNPATAPVAGVETAEGAAPLSAVATIVATGVKVADDVAPLIATAAITATGVKVADDVAPLAAVAAIVSTGVKFASSAAPIAAVATIESDGAAEITPALNFGSFRGGSPFKRRKRKGLFEDELIADLKAAYAPLVGSEAPAVAEIVAPFVASAANELPPILAIDWIALLEASRAVDLMAAIEDAKRREQEEDEALFVLLAA